jgi:hypothetical protein
LPLLTKSRFCQAAASAAKLAAATATLNVLLMCNFPEHSFFQTHCTTIDGQLLYNFINKKTLYFTFP